MALQRILLAEDDADIRMIAELALQDIGGLEVISVPDGQAMLDAIEAARPDLVLMDVMMPNLTGPAALARLREDDRFSQIPVVFMTAKSEHEQLERYRQLGAEEVIIKPFEPMGLAATLAAIYERVRGS